MLLRHSTNIAHQLMQIYNVTVPENNIYVAFNVAKVVGEKIRHCVVKVGIFLKIKQIEK